MFKDMRTCMASGVALAMAATAVGSACAQAAPEAAISGERTAPGYTAPRLAIGQPDLQGVWSNASNTRLTRGSNFDKLVLTDAEHDVAQAENPSNIRQATDDNQKLEDGLLDGKDLARGRGYNSFWIDPGKAYGNVKGTWRTSWIVEPADGKVPFSEEGRKLQRAAFSGTRRGSGYNNPEERSLGERCIIGFGGTGGPVLNNVLYNNNYQFIQSPEAVVIVVEMNHDARVIPLNAKHSPDPIKPYLGDSIGWWEGDTLVVETINVNPAQAMAGAVSLSPDGKVIEKFTRYSEDQILYEFEVHDPALYSQVWKGEMALNSTAGQVYEYACHEGNYGLEGILAGGRAADREGRDISEAGDRDEM